MSDTTLYPSALQVVQHVPGIFDNICRMIEKGIHEGAEAAEPEVAEKAEKTVSLDPIQEVIVDGLCWRTLLLAQHCTHCTVNSNTAMVDDFIPFNYQKIIVEIDEEESDLLQKLDLVRKRKRSFEDTVRNVRPAS